VKFRTPALPLRHPAGLIATWFGVGLMPRAPGTWGSLAALPFAWAIAWAGGVWALAMATLAVALAGWWAADRYIAAHGREDPGDIVVDEVAGQWLTLLPAATDIGLFAAGFVFFRLADILKPWPAGWADRRLHGGLGCVLDDLLAALYSGLAVLLLRLLREWLR
jgi:phosphatidylglycerophosphatase A